MMILSASRVPGKKPGKMGEGSRRVPCWGVGLEKGWCPPFHLLAMPASVQRTFSKAVRCSFPLPYIFRPFSVFPRAHAAFFILTLSPFPIRFRAGPLLTGSPLETLTARFGDPFLSQSPA